MEALQRFQAAFPAINACLQEKVFMCPRSANGETVGQHTATLARESTSRCRAFSGWGGDGKGGKAFTADANSSVGRTVFHKNRGL